MKKIFLFLSLLLAASASGNLNLDLGPGVSVGGGGGGGGGSVVVAAGWVSKNFLGQVNGSASAFTLPDSPGDPVSAVVILDGLLQSPTSDYTLVGAVVTMTTAPAANSSSFFVRYSTFTPDNTARTPRWLSDNFLGQVNGSASAFTLTQAPGDSESLEVILDGFLQSPTSDYTRVGAVVTMTTAPAANSSSFFMRYTTMTLTSAGGGSSTQAATVGYFGGYNGTLGSGSTFFALITSSTMTLKRIVVTIVGSSSGGTFDDYSCGTASARLTNSNATGLAAGTVTQASGNVSIPIGSLVTGRLQSNATITPTANVICEFSSP